MHPIAFKVGGKHYAASDRGQVSFVFVFFHLHLRICVYACVHITFVCASLIIVACVCFVQHVSSYPFTHSPIPKFPNSQIYFNRYKSIKKTNKKYVQATARFPTAARFLEHVGFVTMEVDSIPRYVYVRDDLGLLWMASDLLKSALAILGG